MKATTLLLTALLTSVSLLAENMPANDTRITVIGRTAVNNTDLSFDWTATTLRIAYAGKTLKMRVSDTGRNYFNVWIDCPTSDTPNYIIATQGTDTTITLVPADAPVNKTRRGIHEVTIQKRNEGEQGITTIHEFIADRFVSASPIAERQLEFIGDSYTCGYGAENSTKTDHFTPETENAAKTYAAIAARYFDADYISIAHSGMGIARNYASKYPNWHMPDRYLQTFDLDSTQATRWNTTQLDFHPAMTIIYLGANDFSTAMQPQYIPFRNNYLRLLQEIKANYGQDHPILCLTTKNHEYLFTYVRDIVNTCGLSNVYYLGLCPALHNNNNELGADYHPNYTAHQKIAYTLIPYISTITGWPLNNEIK